MLLHKQKVQFSNTAKLPTKYGVFNIVSFKSEQDFKEHLIVSMGNLRAKDDVLIRVHSECITGHVFTSLKCDCGEQLYGFPEHYYNPKYSAQGAPEIAKEITKLVTTIEETDEWGLDHGAWPMLMHLFPAADVPVFQMSINYNAQPEYHFNMGQQLKSLREKGVLVIGSGSLIHNLSLVMQKMRTGDYSIFGWETEYDAWLKQQLEARNFKDLTNYLTSHKLGKLASPTPDHYVPLLYSLGMMDKKDKLDFFYEATPTIPAFRERSFIIQPENS